MDKLLSISVLLAIAVCSCHGISDRRSIRSAASEVSAGTNPITLNSAVPQDLAAAETVDVFTSNIILLIRFMQVFDRYIDTNHS